MQGVGGGERGDVLGVGAPTHLNVELVEVYPVRIIGD